MSSIGYIQAHAYASTAQLPLRDTAIAITDPNGNLIAMRLTDRSGLIQPVAISVPDRSDSQEPGSDHQPFSTVNLYAHRNGYELVEVESIQVFPETTTYQDLEMIPLSEAADDFLIIHTPPQDL